MLPRYTGCTEIFGRITVLLGRNGGLSVLVQLALQASRCSQVVLQLPAGSGSQLDTIHSSTVG
jgi:hypothetical protein